MGLEEANLHFTLILMRHFDKMGKLKQFINKFAENPVYLFILLITVNMLPIIGLFMTEPFNLLGKIILVAFPFGLYLVLYSLSKKIGLIGVLLFPLLFFHAFQMVVFSLFGEDVISADMFLNLLTTSVSEAGEVLDSLLPAVFFVIVVYIPTTILSYRAMKKGTFLAIKFRYNACLTGAVLILASYVLSFFGLNYNTKRFAFHEDVYPLNMFYNLDFAIDHWRASQDYHNNAANFTFDAKRIDTTNQREIYVIVVGETARTENWSLAGYERETTPLLAQDTNIVFFRDAITQSNATHKSVPIILSAASAENYDLIYHQKSIVTAFKEVGFSTVFLSNQAANRTFTDFFAQEADVYEYYRFFGKTDNNYDEVLVDKMKHYIERIEGDIFFVIHTYGSHFNYTERYPKEFAKYTPDVIPGINKKYIAEMMNAYDNTLLYTDYLLNKITTILEDTDACTAMFYCSDHGEDLLDDNRERFLHASPKPTFYQLRIPFFFWFSPTYKETFPEKTMYATKHKDMAVATNLVFHSMLDVAGISAKCSYPHLSIVNEDFKEPVRMFLDDHYEPIPFANSGLKKQDLEMLDKRNMKY